MDFSSFVKGAEANALPDFAHIAGMSEVDDEARRVGEEKLETLAGRVKTPLKKAGRVLVLMDGVLFEKREAPPQTAIKYLCVVLFLKLPSVTRVTPSG